MHNIIGRKIRGAISVVITASMLVGLLPGLGLTSQAAAGKGLTEYGGTSGGALRGVLDQITELPFVKSVLPNGEVEIDEAKWLSTRGTKDRPFTILEVVGYEEQGEFGYLIGGCEPVRVEEMFGLHYNNGVYAGHVYDMIGHLKTADFASGKDAYFFKDEKEANKDYYSLKNSWNAGDEENANAVSHSLHGYYERVANGTGTHKVSGTNIVKDANGNLVWHTINDYLYDNYPEYKNHNYGAALSTDSLQNIGDRFYTMRISNKTTDPVVSVASSDYRYYHNKEAFLKNSLGLTTEQAANYSVVIKTITPEELNDTPGWVDCADLIYIFPKTQSGGNVPKLWMSESDAFTANAEGRKFVNRLGRKAAFNSFSESNYSTNVFLESGKDISWKVVEKIMRRITAEKNFAGLLMDDNVFESYDWKDEFQVVMYDRNMDKVGLTTNGTYGGKNNFYKLAMMTLAINPNIVMQLYWPYIKEGDDGKGIIRLQQEAGSDAMEYWGPHTFALMEPGSGTAELNNLYNIFAGSDDIRREYFQSFQGQYNITMTRVYTYGHVYTYNSNAVIGMGYSTEMADADPLMFDEFDSFAKKRYQKIGQNKGAKEATPADAVAYILGLGTDSTYYGGNVKVLDLEPCVALDADSKPDWQLTEAAVHLMLPNFTGTVEIDHQTSSEFVGKIEDLNSTYDMIYLGMDYGAFNTVTKWLSEDWYTGNRELTDFNDDSMDGLIYFHVGDSMTNTGERTSVDFLTNVTGQQTLRFPGNDITKIKLEELKSFIAAGRPVAAAKELYDEKMEEHFVDQSTYSNMHTLIKAYRDNGIYKFANSNKLEEKLRKIRNQVTFLQVPALYNGETSSPTTAAIPNPNYLTDRKLRFSFTVSGGNYAYRIYVDKDRNSKFEPSEIIYSSDATEGFNSYTYELASSLVGLIQWKIEVYDKNNSNIHSMRTGCSAVESTAAQKKVVNVLQITPDNAAKVNLNLETNDMFKKYYQSADLKEFKITVKTITWDQFEDYFNSAVDSTRVFDFDMSKPVNTEVDIVAEQNPKKEALEKVQSPKDKNGNDLPAGDLGDYNMIIIGFADAYGSQDMSNSSKDPNNSAIQYLQYFAASGKSILYTHDTTSYYNLLAGETRLNGITPNIVLRDQMGMNRYKAMNYLIQYFREDTKSQMQAYQNKNTYDMSRYDEIHGFTYYAMKRLGWDYRGTSSVNYGNKMPYRYMINNPEGDPVAGVWFQGSRVGQTTGPAINTSTLPADDHGFAKESGFNGNYDVTTSASKLNEGQITTYPYKIDDNLSIADTHGQVYQLNMEDKDVTVWYCLADPVATGGTNPRVGVNNWGTPSASQGNGSALTYGVSPNDAANNYYIYSKGNIFYSGVGHSTVAGDMEAKLFVNTMIAAYRQSYEAPKVEVTNREAVKVNPTEYNLQVLREFNIGDSGDASYEDISDNYVRIYFKPKDRSYSNDLSCRISYVGAGTYIDTVYLKEDDTAYTPEYTPSGTDHKILHMENDKEYYFDYPKANLANANYRTIRFEVWNDVASAYGTTHLYIDIQPLFLLD